jgi:hypothetical protein
MTAHACIGEPISWLRLETFALGTSDAEIATHVAACAVCSRCLEEIRGSSVELPRLVIPATPTRKRRFTWWLVPAMAAAAVALILFVVVPRDPRPELRDEIAYGVKGVGDVILGVVRDRAGTQRDDVLTYAPGDRWKVVVTCPPGAGAWIDVAVIDPSGVDYPLAPARIACGNRVFVPGAFTITGSQPNLVCARVGSEAVPVRTPPRPRDPNVACLTLHPE